MTRYKDMSPAERELADRLFAHHGQWSGPCGHRAAQMWIDEGLTIRCSAVVREAHQATAEHFTGICGRPGSACVITRCGRTYTGADLPS